MKRRFIVFAGVMLAGLLAAATPVSASYSFNASGTWVSNDGLLNGTWSAHFDVAGYDLSGTLNLAGLADVGEGNIAGSWDFNNVGFGVMFLDRELATFTGGLVGDKFQGNFDVGDISGNWVGALGALQLTGDPITRIIDATVPTLLLGQGDGNLGDLVNLGATLLSLGQQIASTSNTITFDNLATPIAALLDGSPDCSVNPLIDKADSFFEFLPQGCSGSACTQVRAVIQSLTNDLPIADGAQLYTCKVKILKQAATGIYQLINSALSGLDINSFPIDISALSGQISVKEKSLWKQIQNGCHCSTGSQAGPLPLPSLLAPLLLIALRARQRRRSTRS